MDGKTITEQFIYSFLILTSMKQNTQTTSKKQAAIILTLLCSQPVNNPIGKGNTDTAKAESYFPLAEITAKDGVKVTAEIAAALKQAVEIREKRTSGLSNYRIGLQVNGKKLAIKLPTISNADVTEARYNFAALNFGVIAAIVSASFDRFANPLEVHTDTIGEDMPELLNIAQSFISKEVKTGKVNLKQFTIELAKKRELANVGLKAYQVERKNILHEDKLLSAARESYKVNREHGIKIGALPAPKTKQVAETATA